jgi:uncharacterized protein (TIGR03437 family)
MIEGVIAQAVAVDSNGGLYMAGITSVRGFLATLGSYQQLYPPVTYWAHDDFVAKFDLSTPAPAAQFTSLANAAGASPDGGYFFGEAVSPGELVSLFGTNLPANPTVTFDGRAAPILYASSTQINTVVPFEVSAPASVVSIQGVAAYELAVFPELPGLFTANGSGTGQLAALNQDGTVNSAANPAKAGSIVSVYLTGAGALTPAIGDGQVGPLQPPYPMPAVGSSATITPVGAYPVIEAPLLFIGQAPGLIAGVLQANIQIPPGTPGGTMSLIVYIGLYMTQAGTIAVQ